MRPVESRFEPRRGLADYLLVIVQRGTENEMVVRAGADMVLRAGAGAALEARGPR